jgi:hypothetical protein
MMNSPYRLVGIAVVFMTVLCTTFGFAQQDNVSVKRIIGDFYEITISGERNGDFADIQMVTTDTHRFRYSKNLPLGAHPALLVYAWVASGGHENARSSYSRPLQIRPTLSDSSDDKIFECALSSDCTHIITFNKRHFPTTATAPWGIKVMTAGEFLLYWRSKP